MIRPPIANVARDLPLLLDHDTVRRHLALDALLPAIEQALIELSAGRVLQPLRTVLELPGPGSLLFVKPALAGGALATKLITQVPGNAARGLPTMIATLLLLDAQTGVPLAVMDATWLTELRTAAVSAVATRMKSIHIGNAALPPNSPSPSDEKSSNPTQAVPT